MSFLTAILLWKTHQCRGVTYNVIDKLRSLSLSKSCPVPCHIYSFHFIRYLWNKLCVFISPSLWRGDRKYTTSISDSFYQMLISQNARKMQSYEVLLPILLRKTRQHRAVTYDVIEEPRRLSLSKCFPALCHKLIYAIAIFHSINWETCDKLIYEIAIFHSKNGEMCDNKA